MCSLRSVVGYLWFHLLWSMGDWIQGDWHEDFLEIDYLFYRLSSEFLTDFIHASLYPVSRIYSFFLTPSWKYNLSSHPNPLMCILILSFLRKFIPVIKPNKCDGLWFTKAVWDQNAKLSIATEPCMGDTQI